MTRPHYETVDDLYEELEVADLLCAHLGAQAVKLPLYSRADVLLHKDGEAVAIVEIKRRNISTAKFSEYMLGMDKYKALCRWADKGFKTYLLVRWTNAVGYIEIPTEHSSGEGGRYDRGDINDTGEMAYIPVDNFTFIQGDPNC